MMGYHGYPHETHNGHRINFFRPDKVTDKLYVITPIFNPIRYRSRWKLYKEFENYVLSNEQAVLVTIECAYGTREFVIDQQHEGNHIVIQVQTEHELWLKENLINIAVSRLPLDWKYVAWVDADVIFARPDWVGETIQLLQHYKIIQMWSQYQDVTPNFEVIGTMRSFMDCYMHGGPACETKKFKDENGYWVDRKRVGYPGAPGLAWAMRRDAWNALGGLIDCSILGACDWYMAHALVGKLDIVLSKKYHQRYREVLFEWQKRADKFIQGNVGVMKGVALHYWHGPKVDRKYGSREQILILNEYNPEVDLKRDWQGLYQLTDRSQGLRDQIRQYFRERNEDHLK
jgi:hypothetical protein